MIRSVMLLGALALPLVSQVTACDPPPPAVTETTTPVGVWANCATPDSWAYNYGGPLDTLPAGCSVIGYQTPTGTADVGPALPYVTAGA